MRTVTRALMAVTLFLLITPPAVSGQSNEDLNVVANWLDYTDAENALYRTFSTQAYDYLEERTQRVSRIESAAEWNEYQNEVREKLMDIVGPFPEKTPLNPRVTGTLERPGFTVEKVIYESRPEFYVTAALFLPQPLDEQAPAIIYASGHTADGFRAEAYQRKVINLVQKGFAVLAFDPLGQGERLQYTPDESGQSSVGGPTREHSYAGAQAFLSGNSAARFMIWDGIRTVDYLMTRPEIDPDRIGITGRSGGGTQSSYIAAFDERIYASAPENYITSFRYLLKSIGPQDAEQNFYHGISSGIDHADLLLAHAPKPNFMITTTRDFFSIQGARETYEEVKRSYDMQGMTDHFSMAEDDHGHGSTRLNREAMYAFFQKHLDNPGSSEDLEVEIFTDEELQVTETGQVITSSGGETVFSLNFRDTAPLLERLDQNRRDAASHLRSVREQAKRLSGYLAPSSPEPPVFTGRYIRDGYSVEKYFIQGEGDYPVPYLLFRPERGENRMIIYLDPGGKSEVSGEGGRAEWLVRQGYTVLVPDLIGIGEMGPGLPRGDSYIGDISYNMLFGGILIGRSITGLRAGDINRLAETSVFSGEAADIEEITLMAEGALTIDALHAAAFNDKLSDLVLIGALDSYQSVVSTEEYSPVWAHSLVGGALTEYDLPDLAALLAPGRLLHINMAGGDGRVLDEGQVDSNFAFVREVFGQQAASGFAVERADSEEEITELIEQWLPAGRHAER